MIPAGYTVLEDGTVLGPRGKPRIAQLSGHPGRGRLAFGVIVNGKPRRVWVHQLVCEAFHGPRPTSEHQVRHLDGNRLNNHATNLAWGTREENDADRKLHGDLAGEQNSSAKLTEGQVKEIRERYAAGGIFQRELAAEYGVSQTNVSRILRRDNWQHI